MPFLYNFSRRSQTELNIYNLAVAATVFPLRHCLCAVVLETHAESIVILHPIAQKKRSPYINKPPDF
jgi:hypothetical protein